MQAEKINNMLKSWTNTCLDYMTRQDNTGMSLVVAVP